MIVGIDTMVVIWALPDTAKQGKKPGRLGAPANKSQDIDEMRRRAKILLHELSDGGDIVVVPTISVSELLRGIDPQNHGTFLAELKNQFLLPGFDLPTAAYAAVLSQKSSTLPKDDGIARVCIKADIQIVASSKMAGATRFYSHERRVRNLAELADMEAKDLPLHGSGLFTEAEMEMPKTEKPKKK